MWGPWGPAPQMEGAKDRAKSLNVSWRVWLQMLPFFFVLGHGFGKLCKDEIVEAQPESNLVNIIKS